MPVKFPVFLFFLTSLATEGGRGGGGGGGGGGAEAKGSPLSSCPHSDKPKRSQSRRKRRSGSRLDPDKREDQLHHHADDYKSAASYAWHSRLGTHSDRRRGIRGPRETPAGKKPDELLSRPLHDLDVIVTGPARVHARPQRHLGHPVPPGGQQRLQRHPGQGGQAGLGTTRGGRPAARAEDQAQQAGAAQEQQQQGPHPPLPRRLDQHGRAGVQHQPGRLLLELQLRRQSGGGPLQGLQGAEQRTGVLQQLLEALARPEAADAHAGAGPARPDHLRPGAGAEGGRAEPPAGRAAPGTGQGQATLRGFGWRGKQAPTSSHWKPQCATLAAGGLDEPVQLVQEPAERGDPARTANLLRRALLRHGTGDGPQARPAPHCAAHRGGLLRSHRAEVPPVHAAHRGHLPAVRRLQQDPNTALQHRRQRLRRTASAGRRHPHADRSAEALPARNQEPAGQRQRGQDLHRITQPVVADRPLRQVGQPEKTDTLGAGEQPRYHGLYLRALQQIDQGAAAADQRGDAGHIGDALDLPHGSPGRPHAGHPAAAARGRDPGRLRQADDRVPGADIRMHRRSPPASTEHAQPEEDSVAAGPVPQSVLIR
ncbi:uncharacterized protein LOC108091097 isoform X1 [Drosophila ficusphila]|uniref:uncharacterized protein LOC108091097 isoform X1 n=1 Tax=Drosophila ficusphila TaxID=30025 RepID=UPI001C89A734|nr:uncharacterized protein LOC108091097 isoform X1 [Drosophila ficusphila]